MTPGDLALCALVAIGAVTSASYGFQAWVGYKEWKAERRGRDSD